MTVIEVVYENGVLKPLAGDGLKEQQHYEAILRELAPAQAGHATLDPDLAAELERRTVILPDGRRGIRFVGALASCFDDFPDDFDPITEALEDLKRERERHFQEELVTFLGTGEIDLATQGISTEQAAALRARLQTCAEDWDSPEMSVYADYDAAKAQL